MSDTENVNEEFSLADLADIDVSEIQEVRFENLPAGVFDLECTNAELGEMRNKDDEKRFTAEFTFKVAAVHAVLESGVDKEALVGKSHTEKLWINPGAEPQKVQDSIGRIRAFVSDAGMDSSGKLGDIVRNMKGHTISKGRITTKKDKEDPSVIYSRLKLDAKKKTA